MAEKEKEQQQEDPEVRIEKLKKEAEELTGGQMKTMNSGDLPEEIELAFWEHVVAFEKTAWTQTFDALQEAGITLPQPDELDDARLKYKLWEAINGLTMLGVELSHTDHLSDRELYADLWHDLLREEMVLQPDNPAYACYLDVIGSGSEEDNFVYLKYYADDEYRQHWAKDFPGDPIPDRETPPFDRDRHLPKRAKWEDAG
ncbi:MAG TPA: hypothetical protein VFD58_25960 [Blastocatellia bacterium]|nr:hypothetical protein [Blastocatellia bacterium]